MNFIVAVVTQRGGRKDCFNLCGKAVGADTKGHLPLQPQEWGLPREASVGRADRVSPRGQHLVIWGIVPDQVVSSLALYSSQKFCELPNILFH